MSWYNEEHQNRKLLAFLVKQEIRRTERHDKVSNGTFATSWKLSIDILMGRNKPLATENEFEYRNEKKLNAVFFGISGVSELWCKDQSECVFVGIVLRLSSWDFSERNETCSYGETPVGNRNKSISSEVFTVFGLTEL